MHIHDGCETAKFDNRRPSSAPVLRRPRVEDARVIHRLVSESGSLDGNSCYAYLLLCRDFSSTCLVAECSSALTGFVTAYRPPARSDVLFVWQIGVAPRARGQGLATRLLEELLAQPACHGIRFLEANITPSNHASWRLFERLARRLAAPMETGEGFRADWFGDAAHEAELLMRIGPLPPRNLLATAAEARGERQTAESSSPGISRAPRARSAQREAPPSTGASHSAPKSPPG